MGLAALRAYTFGAIRRLLAGLVTDFPKLGNDLADTDGDDIGLPRPFDVVGQVTLTFFEIWNE